jgi:hypothetical protein
VQTAAVSSASESTEGSRDGFKGMRKGKGKRRIWKLPNLKVWELRS